MAVCAQFVRDDFVGPAFDAAAVVFGFAGGRRRGQRVRWVRREPGVCFFGFADAAARGEDADFVGGRCGGVGHHVGDHGWGGELVDVAVEPEEVGFVGEGDGLEIVAEFREGGAAFVLGYCVAGFAGGGGGGFFAGVGV